EAFVRAEPAQSTRGSSGFWAPERTSRPRSMKQPIRALTRIGRLPRNSLTQQSLVLRRREISVIAVPERISARKVGSRQKMESSNRITTSCTRLHFLKKVGPDRRRGTEQS